MSATPDTWADARRENAGWLAALLIIAAVVAIGATLWFKYHP
ncbi:MAG: hypothetical protein ACREDE_07320 [Thermoplasmata archaeon]